jgi:hypothetical protein
MIDLDARAYAWSNLGPLASDSSVASDHATGGAGVVKLRGTINLAGVFRPSPGAVVELAYSDGQNWLARLPVRLRVLSSVCNPLQRDPITAVSVGCDLAYFEDRKQPPPVLTARDLNPLEPEFVWRVAVPAISAAKLVENILSALGLDYIGPIPLTNYLSADEFDMTAGYVEELSKLCASEQYIARMTEDGRVQFIKKATPLGTARLLTEDHLIDLNPINTGELPGEAVFAKYTSTILNPPASPDDEFEREKRNWERESSSSAGVYKHAWTRYQTVGTGEFKPVRDSWGNIFYYTFPVDLNGNPTNMVTEEIYKVAAFSEEQEINYIKSSLTLTNYDKKDRVTKRVTLNNDQWGESRTENYYTYVDASSGGQFSTARENRIDYGQIVSERTVEYSPLGPLKMSLGAQADYYELRTSGSYQSLIREVYYYKNENSGITRTVTKTFVAFIDTPDGGEVISRLRNGRQPWEPVEGLVAIATRLVPEAPEVRIRTEREFGVQRRPLEADRTADANRALPSTVDYAETVWLIGSAASQTSVELSPPYTSDDRIVYANNTYTVVKSDAHSKATFYAQNENRLRLGYRNGVGIQVLPETLPLQPLALIYIRLKGCTGAFLVDGVTWNIGPSGVTATCDALFWGAVDGVAANAWFPLPPGTTSLPATAATTTNANPAPANAIAIPNGFNFNNPSLTTLFASLPTGQAPVHDVTISPGSLLPPYQARVSVLAGLGVGAFVNRVNYGASQPRQILAGVGVGAFAQIRSAKKVVAGVGVGAFVEQSQAPPNLEVTWTQTEDGGLEDYVLQAPTFSSTATTSTMTLYYDAALIEDAGIFVNEYTLSYSQWQEFSLVASVQLLIDGQSYPNVISFTMPGRNPYYLDLVVLDEGDWPEVTNPQTLTIIVTATKAT